MTLDRIGPRGGVAYRSLNNDSDHSLEERPPSRTANDPPSTVAPALLALQGMRPTLPRSPGTEANQRRSYAGLPGSPIASTSPRPMSVATPPGRPTPDGLPDFDAVDDLPATPSRLPPPPRSSHGSTERLLVRRSGRYHYPESPTTPTMPTTPASARRDSDRWSFTAGSPDLLPRPSGRLSRATRPHESSHPHMGETFAARMVGALPVQLTNVSVDLIAKLAIDAIGGNGHPGKVATGTLTINGVAFGLETLMHMALTAVTHFPPVARKLEQVLNSGDLPKRDVLYRIGALSAVLSVLGDSWPVRLAGDMLLNVESHEAITAAGTLKDVAGNLVGNLASLGVISGGVYALYKTQPAFRTQADKIVKDAMDGLAALRESRQAADPSDSIELPDRS